MQRQVAPRLAEIGPADELVVAESLGSSAAPPVAEGHPRDPVTPMLTDRTVVDALRRTSSSFLLADGTADPCLDGEVARPLA